MSELTKIKYAHYAYMSASSGLNRALVEGFNRHQDSPLIKKTHYFGDRYENIYIEREKVPEINQVIEQGIFYVSEILDVAVEKLQCGFWFNSMQKGDVTQPHTHDDDDELMSGVYYVEAPKQSGQLIIGVQGHESIVEPEAGKFVFFKPNVIHQVSENLSDDHRLSIGMNFGLKDEFKIE